MLCSKTLLFIKISSSSQLIIESLHSLLCVQYMCVSVFTF